MDPRAPETIETARLRGERIALEHESDLTATEQDPRMFPTLLGLLLSARRSPERSARSWIANSGHWERHGFGVRLWRDRVTGQIVGRGGLQYTEVTGKREVEVALGDCR